MTIVRGGRCDRVSLFFFFFFSSDQKFLPTLARWNLEGELSVMKTRKWRSARLRHIDDV